MLAFEQDEDEPAALSCCVSHGGMTWLPGPQLPGYRSAISAVRSEDSGVYFAVGPSGTDFMRTSGGPWIRIGTVGYDAVSFLTGGATGWAVGRDGRIAKWQGVP